MRTSAGVLLAGLALSAVALGGCNEMSSDSGGTFSDGSNWSMADCNSETGAGGLNANPRGASARDALDAFLVRGTVDPERNATASPSKAGVRVTGWRVLRESARSVVFHAGRDLALVVKVEDGWTVTDVEWCLSD